MDDEERLETGKKNARQCYADLLPVPEGEPDYFCGYPSATPLYQVVERCIAEVS